MQEQLLICVGTTSEQHSGTCNPKTVRQLHVPFRGMLEEKVQEHDVSCFIVFFDVCKTGSPGPRATCALRAEEAWGGRDCVAQFCGTSLA